MARQTMPDDSTKQTVLKLLGRGLLTYSEAARLSGRSKQIIRFWAKDLATDARQKYLSRLWAKAKEPSAGTLRKASKPWP